MKFVAALVATGLLAGAAADVSRQQAAAFQRKLAQIVQRGEAPARTPRTTTTLTELEVNSYLRFGAAEHLPTGVTEPSIGIAGQGRVNGRAVVDLDAVRRARSRGGWFDPMSYLTGRLPVTAAGVLQTANGRGKFTLEHATVGGVPIPKHFLQEIVSHYTRTADLPRGINIDDPFELPAGIDRIDVAAGKATIVQ